MPIAGICFPAEALTHHHRAIGVEFIVKFALVAFIELEFVGVDKSAGKARAPFASSGKAISMLLPKPLKAIVSDVSILISNRPAFVSGRPSVSGVNVMFIEISVFAGRSVSLEIQDISDMLALLNRALRFKDAIVEDKDDPI